MGPRRTALRGRQRLPSKGGTRGGRTSTQAGEPPGQHRPGMPGSAGYQPETAASAQHGHLQVVAVAAVQPTDELQLADMSSITAASASDRRVRDDNTLSSTAMATTAGSGDNPGDGATDAVQSDAAQRARIARLRAEADFQAAEAAAAHARFELAAAEDAERAGPGRSRSPTARPRRLFDTPGRDGSASRGSPAEERGVLVGPAGRVSAPRRSLSVGALPDRSGALACRFVHGAPDRTSGAQASAVAASAPPRRGRARPRHLGGPLGGHPRGGGERH